MQAHGGRGDGCCGVVPGLRVNIHTKWVMLCQKAVLEQRASKYYHVMC